MKFTDNREIWISEDGLLSTFRNKETDRKYIREDIFKNKIAELENKLAQSYNDIDKLSMKIYTSSKTGFINKNVSGI